MNKMCKCVKQSPVNKCMGYHNVDNIQVNCKITLFTTEQIEQL